MGVSLSLLFLFSFFFSFSYLNLDIPSSFLVSVSEKEQMTRGEKEKGEREIVEPTHLADLCLKRVRSKREMEKDLTGEELEEKLHSVGAWSRGFVHAPCLQTQNLPPGEAVVALSLLSESLFF